MSLNTVLKDKKLEDLKTEKPVSVSNLIEPTDSMIEQVITLNKEGKSIDEIKKTVKKKGTNLTLSFGQIKEILTAIETKIVELTPKEDEQQA